MSEVGPIYGVELIREIDLGSMKQAMPGRDELKRVAGISQRTVAGYEALLHEYRDLSQRLEDVILSRDVCLTALRDIARNYGSISINAGTSTLGNFCQMVINGNSEAQIKTPAG
jgi:hypothetical protein